MAKLDRKDKVVIVMDMHSIAISQSQLACNGEEKKRETHIEEPLCMSDMPVTVAREVRCVSAARHSCKSTVFLSSLSVPSCRKICRQSLGQ